MIKVRVFICIVFAFLLARTAVSQVDSVSFEIDTTLIPSTRIGLSGFRYFGGEAIAFTTIDTADYIFSWTIDGTQMTNLEYTFPSVFHTFSDFNPHTVTFEVTEKLTSTSYSKTLPVIIQDNLVIPNVFTPNGDGVNDLFIVRSNGISVLQISIYNRNGVLVYEQKSPTIVWDGKSRFIRDSDKENKPYHSFSEGVYYYILKATDNSIEPRTGIVYLYLNE